MPGVVSDYRRHTWLRASGAPRLAGPAYVRCSGVDLRPVDLHGGPCDGGAVRQRIELDGQVRRVVGDLRGVRGADEVHAVDPAGNAPRAALHGVVVPLG